jgi:TRAP-type C4-dicarboxylate transport system substrate-binding protein
MRFKFFKCTNKEWEKIQRESRKRVKEAIKKAEQEGNWLDKETNANSI